MAATARDTLTSAALVLSSILLAVVAPTGLMALAAILALLRIMWIEENIAEDLTDIRDMPAGYGRARALHAPLMLATALRVEAQGWSVFLLGTLTVWFGRTFSPLLGGLAVLALVACALRRAERCVGGLVCLEAGRPLPEKVLFAPAPLSSAAVNRRK
ncbi:hypothetical protein [Jannaschia aquimarina]|uniref:Uncharacterized protein n=1 Tax=Jannaschia aquimarina TaxID=935700 RepID=A0A0D1D3G8_9RHOB|nr:hypothetical protein [Jannaschia aquimarina]KIT14668.1 hypothetical protein jaqu_36100 [Jannaschia aquimarina]SNT37899.1 hypothetical protein SAMN05421775_11399 [Jannaschia aquimarina]